MEPGANQQKAVEDLMAENRAILEELAQCKADKDFVWNLWRRLQSAQPEVTSVVSMVIAREKEKSEQKDKKVLEILQMKDEKIKELTERALSAEDESHYSKTRYHDLLIENEELKQKLDVKEKDFSSREKEMSEENSYLSSLLKAHQAQKEIDDQTVKENLDHIEEEKNQFKIRIALLEKQVSDFSEEKLKMASAIEVNATLEEKIKSLENELSLLTLKSTEVAKNFDEAELKLTDKENIVKEQLETLQEKSEMIAKLEGDLVAVNTELGQTRESYKQATAQVSEQARIIQQLEENQNNNRVALMDREQEYRKGLASLQKSVADLQARCAVYQENETKLLQDIDRLKENASKQREDLNVKELIIEELKDAVRDGIRSGEVSRREEEEGKGDRRSTQKKVGLEAKMSETASPKFKREKEQGSSGERRAGELDDLSDEIVEESGSEVARNQESMERRLEKISALRELETRLGESRKTVDELKKLLELKEAELVETRRAHSQRQQRYRMLRENYQLVLEQIKTYEASNADGTGSVKPLPDRPEERELRHLDSDQVWKELAHYKHGFEELAKERHDVLEEIDVLRVQHAHNIANIQELRVHLGEEREENSTLQSKILAGNQAFDALRVEMEKLEDQLQSWQEKALRGQTISSELEDENQLLRHEIKALQGQNKALAEEFSGLAGEFENLKKRYDEMVTREMNKKATEVENPDAEVATHTETTKKTTQAETEQLAKQHVESLSSYDEQVRRIADRILSSPSKEEEVPEQTRAITQSTQTDTFLRFVDSSVNVNLDVEDASSMDEEAFDVKGSAKKSVVAEEGSARPQRTPQPKKVVRKTPRRNEWASMKQRILSLTQEVSALRQSKDKAVKALNIQKYDFESLQTEYNSLLSKLQVSRNSVQHLTDSLKLCAREKDLLTAELKEKNEVESRPNALSIAEWKRLEEELRLATMECIRLASIVRTLGSENEDLRTKLKEVQENCSRLEHGVTQKKTLVEEMKSKMRDVEEKAKKDSETAKNLEERLSQLKEREKANKVRIETLEHRLDGESREKQNYHQQLLSCQKELKKKAQQLTR